MQPRDELHVLAYGVVPVAARRDHHVLAKDAESARDDEHGIQRRPAEPAEEERTQVFDDLAEGEQVRGEVHLLQKAAAHLAAVGNAHGAAGSDDMRVLQERRYYAPQAAALEDAVGVDAAKERIARRVE